MSKATKALVTGMRVLGGAKMPTYTIEFLTDSLKHKKGTHTTIVVPYIELGRDKNCAIYFGDDNETVSRKHAAIERTTDGVLLKNLSVTNQTLINGNPVKRQFYLNNGDEFQLSLEGPKMRYNATDSGSAKIGMTQRMGLVMNQAIRPYKTFAISLLAVLLLAISGGGYTIYGLTNDLGKATDKLSNLSSALKGQNGVIDSIKTNNNAIILKNTKKLDSINIKYKKELDDIKKKNNQELNKIKKAVAPNLSKAEKDAIYYIQASYVNVAYKGEKEKVELNFSGSGFLLNDGKFVTARHIVQPWRYLNDNSEKIMYLLNMLEQNGAKLEIEFNVRSTKGDYTISSSYFVFNDHKDELIDEIIDGQDIKLKYASIDNTDWAYAEIKEKATLIASKERAEKLNALTTIITAGYPFSVGAGFSGNVSPIIGKASVGKDGLEGGMILLTDTSIQKGNSGGPAFIVNEKGNYAVIGIISAIVGSELGMLVPISEIYK
ncbi:FHA domain-containing protein [Lutibacter sp.]|uniref:FHA domain-containing protein n=1 Tax=Lutibacter sp. TaxID=1925666 RepID=UPI003569C9C9